MPVLFRALISLARSWRAILALTGLVAVAGFSAKEAMQQAGESVWKNSWIIALICITVVAREFVVGYYAVKKIEADKERKKKNE